MKTILIAEDEKIVALELSMELKKYGFNVLKSVSTGRQLIKEAFDSKPDIIVSDIHLKDGIKGTEAVTKIKTELNPLIIIISAYSDPETLKSVFDIRPEAFLFKPVNALMIKEVVEKAERAS